MQSAGSLDTGDTGRAVRDAQPGGRSSRGRGAAERRVGLVARILWAAVCGCLLTDLESCRAV